MRVLEFQAEAAAEQTRNWEKRQLRKGQAGPLWGGILIALAIAYVVANSSALRLEPTQLYFGAMTVGASATQQIRVVNDSGTPVNIVDIVPLDSGGDFSVASTNCRTSLAPKEDCSFVVRFRPTREEQQVSSVVLKSEIGAVLREATVSGGGIQAPGQLTLDTNELDFGERFLREEATSIVTVRNEGQSPIRLSMAVRGNSSQFLIHDDCSGQPISAEAYCQLQVTYSPTAAGHAGIVVVFSDNLNKQQTLIVRGYGKPRLEPPPPPPPTTPASAISPAILDFGVQRARLDSSKRETTILSSGKAPLKLQRASLTGWGFQIVSDTCSARTLAPQDTCKLAVKFEAEQPGAYSGKISIASNAPTGAVTAALTATVIAPGKISVSDRGLDFGTYQLLRTNVATERDLIVENIGSAALRLATPGLQSPDGAFSIKSADCGRELTPGSTCRMQLNFFPSSPGSKSANLVIYVQGDPAVETVSLSGTAVLARPVARLVPQAIDFGMQELRASASRTITLQNVGDAELSISRVSTIGETSEFSVRNGCIARLAPGGSCPIEVVFAPGSRGERTDALSVVTDSSIPVEHVNLRGVGVPPKKSGDASQGTPDKGASATIAGIVGQILGTVTKTPTVKSPAATCWQPKADHIDFELLSRRPEGSGGHFRITGVVTNSAEAITGPEPAIITLFANSTALATSEIQVLSSGRATVSSETDFSRADEFPPTYRLVVSIGNRQRPSPAATGPCNPVGSEVQRAGSDMGQLLRTLHSPKQMQKVAPIPPK